LQDDGRFFLPGIAPAARFLQEAIEIRRRPAGRRANRIAGPPGPGLVLVVLGPEKGAENPHPQGNQRDENKLPIIHGSPGSL
jgi:hypothetical protein